MALTKTYAPGQVAPTVNGKPVTGWTRISFGRNNPSATVAVSADGSSAFAISADRSGFVEIELQQTSPSNGDFSSLLSAQELLQASFAKTISVADLNGTTVVSGVECAVEQLPESEFGTEVGTRVWRFITGNLVATLGGNS